MNNFNIMSGLDYVTQKDILDDMFTNPMGIDFSSMDFRYIDSEGEGYYDLNFRGIMTSSAAENRTNEDMFVLMRSGYRSFKRKKYKDPCPKIIYDAMQWMLSKCIAIDLDSLNKFGIPNGLVAYGLFNGLLVDNGSEAMDSNITEALQWFAKNSYNEKSRQMMEVIKNERRRRILIGGKKIVGGLISEDVVPVINSYIDNIPVLKNSSIDIINCCIFADSYNDIKGRLLWMLNELKRYWPFTTYVNDIVTRPDPKIISIYRYVLCALYMVSKVCGTRFYKASYQDQIELYMLDLNIDYPHNESTKKRKCGSCITRVTKFCTFIEKSGFDYEKEFAEVMSQCGCK